MKLEKLIDASEIAEKVKELGKEISDYYGNNPVLVIGILKGSFIFMGDLIREIKSPVKVDFVVAKSYDGDRSTGKIDIRLEPYMDISGEDVLIVEDIVDTGLTAKVIKDFLLEKGARSVKMCAIIDRKVEGKEITPDFPGFEISDNRFLVGYGLDLNEEYRELPHIYAVEFSD